MSQKIVPILLFLALLSINTMQGQQMYRQRIELVTDNDLYVAFNKDRYYSNGLFVTYSRLSETDAGRPKKIRSIGIGQRMYMPYRSRVDSLHRVDRPFAAYLYLSASLAWFTSDDLYQQLTVQAGTIGPAARGREVQEFTHRLLGIFKPRGWQYQLANECGINVVYDRMQLLYRSRKQQFDISLPLQLNVGNTFSSATAGLLLRIGKLSPLASSTHTGGSLGVDFQHTRHSEYVFYLHPKLRYVAYDATIQGRLFGHDDPHAQSIQRLVFETTLGATYSVSNWQLHLAAHLKSKESARQKYWHRYGSIGIAYRF